MMTSNTDFLLAIENLTVAFDGFKAVNDLTINVDHHELRVVIGPNGAGKTTLLDLICGKTAATSGSIRFKNREITRMSEHRIVREGIGRKFQTPSIYENLSVFENLEVSYPASRNVLQALFFATDDTIDQKIREIAELIFLTDELEREASLLSYGQKQWLEIGMLLIQDPELLMLDEPVAGMSANEREQTAVLLGQISKDRAVIAIEHDMDFVARIANRVTVLHQGQVLADGPMSEIKTNEKVIEVYLGH
jgi:urea transport system ATP-binding protein